MRSLPAPGAGEGECARGDSEYKASSVRPRGEGTRGSETAPVPSSGTGALPRADHKGDLAPSLPSRTAVRKRQALIRGAGYCYLVTNPGHKENDHD